jgi:hypothetical protein
MEHINRKYRCKTAKLLCLVSVLANHETSGIIDGFNSNLLFFSLAQQMPPMRMTAIYGFN